MFQLISARQKCKGRVTAEMQSVADEVTNEVTAVLADNADWQRKACHAAH